MSDDTQLSTVLQKIRSGDITGETMVWAAGMADWTPLAAVEPPFAGVPEALSRLQRRGQAPDAAAAPSSLALELTDEAEEGYSADEQLKIVKLQAMSRGRNSRRVADRKCTQIVREGKSATKLQAMARREYMATKNAMNRKKIQDSLARTASGNDVVRDQLERTASDKEAAVGGAPLAATVSASYTGSTFMTRKVGTNAENADKHDKYGSQQETLSLQTTVHYQISALDSGTTTLEQLLVKIASCDVTARTKVWTKGMKGWQSLEQVAQQKLLSGVADALLLVSDRRGREAPKAAPAPRVTVTAVHVKSFYYETSPGVRSEKLTAAQAQAAVSSGTVAPHAKVWAPGMTAWRALSELELTFEGVAQHVPPPSPSPQRAAAAPPKRAGTTSEEPAPGAEPEAEVDAETEPPAEAEETAEELPREVMLAQVFAQLDTNHSGKLDGRELRRALKALGLKEAGVSVDQVLAVLDCDNDSFIDVNEWVARLPDAVADCINAQRGADGLLRGFVADGRTGEVDCSGLHTVGDDAAAHFVFTFAPLQPDSVPHVVAAHEQEAVTKQLDDVRSPLRPAQCHGRQHAPVSP